MVKRRNTLVGLGCIALLLGSMGCASTSSADLKIDAREVRPALRGLAFPYRLRRVSAPGGDDAAFLGVAHNGGGATLHFSIGIGDVPTMVVIPHTRRQDPVGNVSLGFVFNDDTADGRKFSSAVGWHAAMHMATEVEEAICKKAAGEPCPI